MCKAVILHSRTSPYRVYHDSLNEGEISHVNCSDVFIIQDDSYKITDSGHFSKIKEDTKKSFEQKMYTMVL